ncbi:MAG TPA: Rieske (2Fe-2S) protein [Coriobacteriia bacterium]|nr:Rieske (2Fe-2S) protein [Coriobacteriia bacterium]
MSDDTRKANTVAADAAAASAGATPPLDRRSFLVWAAGASLGASGLFVLATMTQALLPPGRSIDGLTEVGAMPVARLSDLEIGKPVLAEYGDDKIFVVKTSHTEALAFDAACPHARGTLSYNENARRFDCPCHASSFEIDGRKIMGPSPRDMVPAVTQIVNGEVIVSGFAS